MSNEKINEKKEDLKIALLMVENMLESDKIGRFKFTPKEQSSLLFVTELLTLHLNELKNIN